MLDKYEVTKLYHQRLNDLEIITSKGHDSFNTTWISEDHKTSGTLVQNIDELETFKNTLVACAKAYGRVLEISTEEILKDIDIATGLNLQEQWVQLIKDIDEPEIH